MPIHKDHIRNAIGAAVAYLFVIWLAFLGIQDRHAATITRGLQAAFRSEIAGGNGYVLAQSVSDFEKLTLVQCGSLSGEMNGVVRVFQETPEFVTCGAPVWALLGKWNITT